LVCRGSGRTYCQYDYSKYYEKMLQVIYGPMYSGKSEELIKRLVRAQIGGKTIRAIKPEIDDRFGKIDTINSHAGSHFECESVLEIRDSYPMNIKKVDIVGVDEAQFFDKDQLLEYVDLWRKYFKVIVAGLNLDFRKQPFGAMVDLINIADSAIKLTAVCHKCQNDNAIFTQRLIDGEPAPLDGPVIQVGGMDSYEARCYNCYGV
jgi:thymidine kinase